MSGLRLATLALVVGLLVAGCGLIGAGTSNTPLAHVRALPEASLVPAGSVVIGTFAQDAHETVDGLQPAVYTRVYGTQEPARAVETFYAADALPRAGWIPERYSIQPDIASWSASWTKGPFEMSVSILRRGADPYLPWASMEARYPTIFEVVLSAGAGASFPP